MIGILGGTFDPIHRGHLEPARELLYGLPLQAIRFVLARVPPHRDPPATSPTQRWEMLSLALAAYPGFIADDRELRREGPSYTVDTLRCLRTELGEQQILCLIMGSDAFVGFTSWRRWEEILQLAHLVVTTRPGGQMSIHGPAADLLKRCLCSGSQDLERHPAGRILPFAVRPVDISATAIRAAIAAGKDVGAMLPSPVWQYIREHGLYSATRGHIKVSKIDDGN